METKAIAVINGQQIQVSNDEQMLVPIKPICQALGVDYEAQYQKVNYDEILSSAISLNGIVAADGKTRNMVCLPLKYIYGWLFTINPKNVSEEARSSVLRYKQECYDILYDHFTRGMKKERELLEAENALLKERDEAAQNIAYMKEETTRLKGLLNDIDGKLIKIRDERHNPQPSLFD